jgi:hypothetical protein
MLLAFASTAHAEDVLPWIFLNKKMPVEANISGLTSVKKGDEGIEVDTTVQGGIFWDGQPVPNDADIITVYARASSNTEMLLVWRPTDKPGEEGMYQLSETIPASPIFMPVHFIVSQYDGWDPKTEEIALAFPAGSKVTIREIQFRDSTFSERAIERMKSFFRFDDFRQYSINFLWGPVLAPSHVEQEILFERLPPIGWSAFRIVYALIALAAVIAIICGLKKGKAVGMTIMIATVGGLWLLLDLRMGAEIISYAKDDLKTFVFERPDKKELRTHGTLYVMIEKMRPIISKYERYGLYVAPQTVSYANMRYAYYPSVPVPDGDIDDDLQLWAIVQRPDIRLNAERRLIVTSVNGSGATTATIISPPGKIVQTYEPGTFLFATDQ